jgi:hypothetical protein
MPVLTFQIRIVLSPLPLANKPSGKTTKEKTELECPVNVLIVMPVLTFQIRIVLSKLPLAKKPSGKTTKA